MDMQPLVLVIAVGLTSRLLPLAPRLKRLADLGWARSLDEVIPAVTCTAQATLLTGVEPRHHGIVGNGWLFRDTGEVRFWQQSNALLQAEPIYVTAQRYARKRGRPFRTAKLFWWFNQGADVEISVTPKPYYGADGNKIFAIAGTPETLVRKLELELGAFPFPSFWGPTAGLPATQWIAQASARILRWERPELTLVYLPHLDYDPQRFGPTGCDLPRLLRELDEACSPLLDAAQSAGARVWIVSEYGHCDVSRPVLLNRSLRAAGLLKVRSGPFGETLDTFQSDAFAVCDHQIAHVYVRKPEQRAQVRDLVVREAGVSLVYEGPQRSEIGLDHERAGDLVVLSEADSWFAYPYWLDERAAPDFARTVDIHRKPGYDPCELFFDPKLFWAQGRVVWRLIQKRLGFRTLFDVIPLDPTLVRGSHGIPARHFADRPILIADTPHPPGGALLRLSEVHRLILQALIPEEELPSGPVE